MAEPRTIWSAPPPGVEAAIIAEKAAGGPPSEQPLPPRVGGIAVSHQSPLPSDFMQVNDVWSGPVNGVWVVAYAGASSLARATGRWEPAVALFTEPVDTNAPGALTEEGVYGDPEASGQFTVRRAAGSVLSLSDAAGTTWQLDMASHSLGS